MAAAHSVHKRESDHLFARLARYTRFVAYSKWSLLAVALVLVVTLIVWPLVTKDKSGIRVSFIDHQSLGEAVAPSSPVMNNPEYRGVGDNGQQYRVNGIRATQKTPTLILIEQVEAQMLKADNRWYSLTADTAEYMQDKKLIELIDHVTLIDDASMHFVTSRATVETDTMDVHGNQPVSGTGSFGNIVASGFEIRDNGKHLIFVGGEKQLEVTVDRARKKS